MNMNMRYTEQVFRITDLVKYIGKFKHQFELVSDIEKLNNSFDFQHIVFHIFHNKFDTSIVLRNETERCKITVCFCEPPTVNVIFKVFKKYKRKPFYVDNMIFNMEKQSNIQYNLANWILYDKFLLPFFK